MDIQQYRKQKNVKAVDVVDILKGDYPGISKSVVSMAESGKYGVQFTPEAMEMIVQFADSKLRADLQDCKNELCQLCGRCREEHLGACDGCRWKNK